MGLVHRMAGALGLRSFMPPVYDATAKSARLPRFRDPSPSEKRQGQKEMRAAARHLARNNHRFAITLGKKAEILIGTGPRPKSIYPELVDIWESAKDHFDNTGQKNFADWLADDVNHNLEVDGEIFVRARPRNKYDDPAYKARYAHLPVPIQFQALTCDFVDETLDTEWIGNLRFKQGVAMRNDQRLGYAIWTTHPLEVDENGLPGKRIVVTAEEMCHVFTGGTGAIRGENPLATVIKTAKDLQDTEDSELNRRKASQFWATFLVKKASSDGLELGGPAGGGDAPASKGPDKSTRNLAVGMGDMAVVEEGYEPKMVQPAGEGAGFQTAVRIQTSLITNTVGIPYHEAMNDWDAVPERAMRPASVSMKRRMLKDRGKRERLLNWMWRWFVRVCMEEGLWTPPPGATPAEIFKVTWRWPVIHTVTPEREMKTGAELIKLGLMTPEHFVEDFVGEEYKEFLRRLVTNMAQAKVQGSTIYDDVFDPEVPIAADYMSVAEEEEALQRQLVRTARLDRSARTKPAV